jgi:hypothetical protein
LLPTKAFSGIGGIKMPGHLWARVTLNASNSLYLLCSSKGPSESTPVTVYLMWPATFTGFLTVNCLSLGSSSRSPEASSSYETSSIFIFFMSDMRECALLSSSALDVSYLWSSSLYCCYFLGSYEGV